MHKNQSVGIWIVVIILTMALFSMLFTPGKNNIEELSYSAFLEKVQNSEIKKVDIEGESLIAEPKNQPTTPDPQKQPKGITLPTSASKLPYIPKLLYEVQIPQNSSELYTKLEANKVEINIKKNNGSNPWLNILGSALFPLLLLGVIFMLMIKTIQAGGSQAMSFGKSKAKMMQDKVKVTFKDVAGIDEEKQEFEEIVDFLKNGEKYIKLGAKIPKGILLVGAPGTGKTLDGKSNGRRSRRTVFLNKRFRLR